MPNLSNTEDRETSSSLNMPLPSCQHPEFQSLLSPTYLENLWYVDFVVGGLPHSYFTTTLAAPRCLLVRGEEVSVGVLTAIHLDYTCQQNPHLSFSESISLTPPIASSSTNLCIKYSLPIFLPKVLYAVLMSRLKIIFHFHLKFFFPSILPFLMPQ